MKSLQSCRDVFKIGHAIGAQYEVKGALRKVCPLNVSQLELGVQKPQGLCLYDSLQSTVLSVSQGKVETVYMTASEKSNAIPQVRYSLGALRLW